MGAITSYRDLLVWQRGVELVVEVYRITGDFPRHEQFGLTGQMRRAACSIPANLAEGHARPHSRDSAASLPWLRDPEPSWRRM